MWNQLGSHTTQSSDGVIVQFTSLHELIYTYGNNEIRFDIEISVPTGKLPSSWIIYVPVKLVWKTPEGHKPISNTERDEIISNLVDALASLSREAKIAPFLEEGASDDTIG
jgi:hypothetical protein